MLVQNSLNRLLAGALFASMASLPIAAQSNSSSSNATATPAAPSEAASGYCLLYTSTGVFALGAPRAIEFGLKLVF